MTRGTVFDDVLLKLDDALLHLVHVGLRFFEMDVVLGDQGLMLCDTEFGGLSHDFNNLRLLTEMVVHCGGAIEECLVHVLEQSLVLLEVLADLLHLDDLGHSHRCGRWNRSWRRNS